MDSTILAFIICLAFIALISLSIGILRRFKKTSQHDELNKNLITLIEKNERNLKDEFVKNREEAGNNAQKIREELSNSFKNLSQTIINQLNEVIRFQRDQFKSFDGQLISLIKTNEEKLEKINSEINSKIKDIQTDLNTNTKDNRDELTKSLKSFEEKFTTGINDFNERLRQKFNELNKQQSELSQQSRESIKEVKDTVEKQLKSIRQDNTQQLTEMRKTVDEKLQSTLEKRLGESFKQVSDRLEQVHKGLGEMQNLATGVGDLKKVLSNVKTRGILGEYQLGNILEQILSPEQYARNVATKRGSQANVEYAIRFPGKKQDEEVWIPIDSKFPIESYHSLVDAYDDGEQQIIEAAQKQLFKTVESFAKDISSKYIDPPHTTDFGIMFLPIESLYAEVLRHPGLFEILQRKYNIIITGPTTLSALLNSFQMGFRTLAVQKHSSEVWKVLSAVKVEFSNFSEQLTRVHKQLNTASNSLDTLRKTRTNVMKRKLRDIETLDTLEAKRILELPKNDNDYER